MMNNAMAMSTTGMLLNRIKTGDRSAEHELLSTVTPILTRWAHRRIPYSMRGVSETQDYVQETLLRGLSRIDQFESLRPGAFLAYLRQIFINCINMEFRRREHRNDRQPLDSVSQQESALSAETDLDSMIEYDKALEKLSPLEKQAVVLRLEFGLSFAEVAREIGKSTANAARMFVSRALVKLAEVMNENK